MAAGAIRTDYIVGIGRSISFGEKGHAAIVDQSGKVIAHPLANWRASMKDISAVPPVKKMMNGETGVSIFYSPALDADMIAGFTSVEGPGWGVMVPQPLSELKARAAKAQQHAIGGLVSGTALAVLLSWIISGYLTRPVLRVVAAAKKFTGGDYSARVKTSGRKSPSELSTLATNFNEMAESVSDAHHRLSDALNVAETASRAKTEFLAHMSHELRTPLNSIIGFSQMLSSGKQMSLSDDVRDQYARNIEESGRHLLGIIGDILEISKIEAGEYAIVETAIGVDQLLHDNCRMMEGMAKDKGIEIKYSQSPDMLRILADQRVIAQIVMNLLSNAIKFSDKGTEVSVSAELDDDGGISIYVSDEGPGIASADAKKVFQPFTQIRSSSQHAHEGTGLGLTISKRLTELHGGALNLRNNEGRGMTAAVHLPASRTIQ